MVSLRLVWPAPTWIAWPWRLSGVALILIGAALDVITDQQFKRRQTTIKPFEPSRALVTDGLFRFSRNPMYLGMMVILAGLGICLATLPPLVVIPLFGWWITVRFIAVEEQHLAEQFGDAYTAYCAQARRWI